MRPAAIAAALDDRFRLLTGGGKSAQPRQQTLEASVAWSYDLLNESERTLLRRLSVFNGGFALNAAEAVCSDEIIDSYSVLELLSGLVDKSLVQADDMAADTRYRLLETIRHYTRARLLDSAETGTVRQKHLDWFLAFAERAEPELAWEEGPSWMVRLEREHDNLQSALEWADATGQHEVVLRLVGALGLFWEIRGHRQQGIGGRWFAKALEFDNGPSRARARALWAAGHMGIYGGDVGTTILRTPEALAVAEAVGDQQTIARARITINYIRAMLAPKEGVTPLAEAIELARSGGDQWAVADGLKVMTIAWAAQGNYDRGLQAARDLAGVANRLGNKFFLAWSHAAVAYVALRRGDFVAAREDLVTAIGLCEQVGDPITRWLGICWLGEVDALTGDYGNARRRYEDVVHKGVASDGDLARHTAVPDLGALLLALGEVSAAARILEPAVADFQNEVPLMRTPFLLVRGQLLLAQGDDAGARAEFRNGERSCGADGQCAVSGAGRPQPRIPGPPARRAQRGGGSDPPVPRRVTPGGTGARCRRRVGGSGRDRHRPGERRRGRRASSALPQRPVSPSVSLEGRLTSPAIKSTLTELAGTSLTRRMRRCGRRACPSPWTKPSTTPHAPAANGNARAPAGTASPRPSSRLSRSPPRGSPIRRSRHECSSAGRPSRHTWRTSSQNSA